MQKERNYGIDALRIISMWMVVVLHVMGHGGILSNLVPFSLKYEVLWLLETLVYCAVNCYALISGYVGLNSKFKLSNLFYLWLEVFFYSVLITLTFIVFIPGTGRTLLLKSLFPVMSDQYWYFTAYFALFFLTPFLNHLISTLSKRKALQLIISLVFIFSVIPTVCHTDVFYTKNGYTVVWLATLYFIGAYIKKYGLRWKASSGEYFFAFMLFASISWGGRFLIEGLTNWKLGELHAGNYLTEYTSPTILGSALSLFIIFANVKIETTFVRRIISALAPLSFGVYLISDHPLIREYIISERFTSFTNKHLASCIVLIILTAIAIYFACTGIDAVRWKLFDKLHIRDRFKSYEERVRSIWNYICELILSEG